MRAMVRLLHPCFIVTSVSLDQDFEGNHFPSPLNLDCDPVCTLQTLPHLNHAVLVLQGLSIESSDNVTAACTEFVKKVALRDKK